MDKIVRILGVIICLIGLMSVRFFETKLFYDPILSYFHGDFLGKKLPEFDEQKHLISIALRYVLNAILSLGIIYCIFKNKLYLRWSVIIFIIGSITLLPLYQWFIDTNFSLSPRLGFYTRRFLIQPMLGIVLILALFYVEKTKKSAQ